MRRKEPIYKDGDQIIFDYNKNSNYHLLNGCRGTIREFCRHSKSYYIVETSEYYPVGTFYNHCLCVYHNYRWLVIAYPNEIRIAKAKMAENNILIDFSLDNPTYRNVMRVSNDQLVFEGNMTMTGIPYIDVVSNEVLVPKYEIGDQVIVDIKRIMNGMTPKTVAGLNGKRGMILRPPHPEHNIFCYEVKLFHEGKHLELREDDISLLKKRAQ